MSLQLEQSWEYRLLTWAQDGLNSFESARQVSIDHAVMEAAYQQCEAITQTHSRTFHMASALLPEFKRKAARALYAFCRVSDDIVDTSSSTEERQEQLAQWRIRTASEHPPASDPVALAWADTKSRFKIPDNYATHLIDGVARDLEQTRYQSFDELAEYAYGVASTVGLMAMHIIGFKGEEALPYAVKLGVALQITNILRDVGEDWRAGRLYLPQDELEAFGLTEADIAKGVVTDRWRKFMRYQIKRNRRLYKESRPGIAMLDPDGRFAIAAAADLYEAILEDIEVNDYQVFTRRAHVSTIGKLSRLPKIWWRSRRSTND